MLLTADKRLYKVDMERERMSQCLPRCTAILPRGGCGREPAPPPSVTGAGRLAIHHGLYNGLLHPFDIPCRWINVLGLFQGMLRPAEVALMELQ